MPLYRLEKDLAYWGINISSQTMDNLVIAAAEMMIPLYELMHKIILRQDILHADETHTQVNRVKGRHKPVKGYMWLYRSGRYSTIPAGVKHWHGAAANSWFSHLAVEVPGENTKTEWLESVDEVGYKNAGEVS